MEKIERTNSILNYILKIAYINFLWIITTCMGIVFFSIGPATYAMFKCYDQWLRLNKEVNLTKSYFSFFKEKYKQSMLISWIYIIVFTIFIANIFLNKIWIIQITNVLMMIFVLFTLTYVFSIMATTNYKNIFQILKGAALLGFGYLHYSIIVWTVIFISAYLLSNFAPAVLFLFGAGAIGFACSIVNKKVLSSF